jgi:MYXO-CTERM domain-containing protein
MIGRTGNGWLSDRSTAGIPRSVAAVVLLFLLGAARADAQSIEIREVTGSAGQKVEVPIFWTAGDSKGSGISIDIRGANGIFDSENGHPACRFSPEIRRLKEASASAFRPPQCTVGRTCTSIRVGVISFVTENNPLPVPSGEILRCSFTIPPDAKNGAEFRFAIEAASYILPDGSEFPITAASSGGAVRVGALPQAQAVAPKASDGCMNTTPANPGDRRGLLGLLPLLALVVLRRRLRMRESR